MKINFQYFFAPVAFALSACAAIGIQSRLPAASAPDRVSFSCDELDNINTIRDVFTRTAGGYDVKRLTPGGTALSQLTLTDSEITVQPLSGLGSFHFVAKSSDGSIQIDITVAGQGSRISIKAPSFTVNRPTAECTD